MFSPSATISLFILFHFFGFAAPLPNAGTRPPLISSSVFSQEQEAAFEKHPSLMH